jgi:AAA15 family ATPase/GTPase
MVVEKIYIEKFRAFKNLEIELGRITAVIGKNGTLKTTLLGIISQMFTLTKSISPMHGEKTIDGYNYRSQFSEKFKISKVFDKPGDHRWKLYMNREIYSLDDGLYEAESIKRGKEYGDIRFWNAKGRKKGYGFIQCPVVYLSLKRLLPIGEEEELKTSESSLTSDENNLLISWYEDIFSNVSSSSKKSVIDLQSDNKFSVSINNDDIDPITISAGQDNIGKILISILSFRRLKEKYKDDYKGGLLLIDEIESTLHSSALIRLMKLLNKFTNDYNLQIIFTTHSYDIVIKELKSANYINDCKIIYLQRKGDNIVMRDDLTLNQIKSDLGNEKLPKNEYSRIRVYTEDEKTKYIAKSILPNEYIRNIEFVSVSLSHGNYKNLLQKKCREFLNSIILVDGDVKKCDSSLLRYKNVLALPGEFCPEKMFYKYLRGLSEEDEFWESDIGGYTKQVCFRDYMNIADDTNSYKKWYESQKSEFGRSLSKIMKRWKKDNQDEVEKFNKWFENCYKTVKKNIDK